MAQWGGGIKHSDRLRLKPVSFRTERTKQNLEGEKILEVLCFSVNLLIAENFHMRFAMCLLYFVGFVEIQ